MKNLWKNETEIRTRDLANAVLKRHRLRQFALSEGSKVIDAAGFIGLGTRISHSSWPSGSIERGGFLTG
jgi:hypothetical protein